LKETKSLSKAMNSITPESSIWGPESEEEERGAQELHNNAPEESDHSEQQATNPTSHPAIFARDTVDGAFTHHVNEALARIRSRPKGGELLDKVATASNVNKGKRIVVRQPSADEIRTRAFLTPHQAQKTGHPQPVADNRMATELAQKRKIFGVSLINGRGTQAEVHWDPNKSLRLDAQGRPIGLEEGGHEAFVNLAHELVHGKHMMAGNLKRGGDPENPATPSGQEEVRAIRHENAIRDEHDLSRRTQYGFVESSDEEQGSEAQLDSIDMNDLRNAFEQEF
jgi:Effector protein